MYLRREDSHFLCNYKDFYIFYLVIRQKTATFTPQNYILYITRAMEDSLSLYELNRMVARTIADNFGTPLWVTAEIASMNVASNGHCYLELIEKNPKTGSTTARAKAMVWANRWWLVKETFEQGTGQPLQAGMKVMVQVMVNMHEAYGYSLVIQDIEPSYTLGEMQRKRMEIIQRLTEEGMIDMNRSVPMPRPVQRIAIVSANTAAGYGDFCHQLENNEFGLKFYTYLFPAQMQGEQTEASVITALNKIYEHQEKFDVVVIIRGGGSVVDLNSFDSYELALNIANFPLPVIVGIGHERDNTVLDTVAHLSVKTPTAAAAFLIEHMADELSMIDELQTRMLDSTQGRIEREQLRLDRYNNVIQGTHIRLGQQLNRLTLTEERIGMILRHRLEAERQKMEFAERTIQMAQPDNILRRGFSIARVNGKAIKDASQVKAGDIIETELACGKIRSTTLP